MKTVIGLGLLVLSMTACSPGGSGGGNSNGSANQGPVIKEAEFVKDFDGLTEKTAALEKMGLKYTEKYTENSATGAADIITTWDEEVLARFFKENPNFDMNVWIKPLEEYISLAEAYVAKYSKFQLMDNTNTVKPYELKKDVKDRLETRVTVAKKTIAKIKEDQKK